jgi:hypothetical protein
MPYIKRTSTTREKNIFLYAQDNQPNRNATVPNTKIALNSSGKREVPEGCFVAVAGGVYRYLPRATVATATATNSTSVVLGDLSQLFASGDVLTVVEPYVKVTVGGTLAENDTFTVTIDGISVTATADASPTAAEVATALETAINANTNLTQRVTVIRSSAILYIFGKDGLHTYSAAVSKSSTNGTITCLDEGGNAATALEYGSALGTVSSVNVATQTITLSGNASAVVPVGTHIGVAVTDILGLDAHQRDYTDESVQTIGLYNISSGVRENYLPYIDGDIKRRFPQLNFLTRA